MPCRKADPLTRLADWGPLGTLSDKGRGEERKRSAMPEPFSFRLLATDGAARRGEIVTPHGSVQTPAFMPVGTQGT